jgi:hypothetical protein
MERGDGSDEDVVGVVRIDHVTHRKPRRPVSRHNCRAHSIYSRVWDKTNIFDILSRLRPSSIL